LVVERGGENLVLPLTYDVAPPLEEHSGRKTGR